MPRIQIVDSCNLLSCRALTPVLPVNADAEQAAVQLWIPSVDAELSALDPFFSSGLFLAIDACSLSRSHRQFCSSPIPWEEKPCNDASESSSVPNTSSGTPYRDGGFGIECPERERMGLQISAARCGLEASGLNCSIQLKAN
mmetsp:Transcript_20655/g.34036  ORF Transcript_20655/g.34036 Transcript_20655/m.34036 type:complete len:142 (-) Transcript_20655:642-1067(-)